MYRRHRVAYGPDDDDTDIREYLRNTASVRFEEAQLPFPRKLTDLLILIHVAAARAFVLKENSGLSEEVVDCLDEVERAWQRLQRAGFPGSVSPDVHTSEFYEIFHSIDAVSAIALAERSRVTWDQGHYAEALHMLATADERYSSGAILVTPLVRSAPIPEGTVIRVKHHSQTHTGRFGVPNLSGAVDTSPPRAPTSRQAGTQYIRDVRTTYTTEPT